MHEFEWTDKMGDMSFSFFCKLQLLVVVLYICSDDDGDDDEHEHEHQHDGQLMRRLLFTSPWSLFSMEKKKRRRRKV